MMLNVAGLVFNVEPVRAAGTIYIHADGSIEPTGAPIVTSDNVTYLLMNNTFDSIVIERSYIMFHGNNYTIQGSGSGVGIDLNNVANVTVEDTRIVNFQTGVNLHNSAPFNHVLANTLVQNQEGIVVSSSNNNHVWANNIVNCSGIGIFVFNGTGNTVEGNHLSECDSQGIQLGEADSNNLLENTIEYCNQGLAINFSSYNTVKLNIIRNNINGSGDGIFLTGSPSNILTENMISANSHGVGLAVSNDSSFYHNNLINNTQQVYDYAYSPPYLGAPKSCNAWDNGYPSCGNYWSNYTGADVYSGPFQNETDPDGAGDTVYTVDASNIDNYPLMNPWTPDFTVSNTMVIAFPYSPRSLDPACAYDTASGEMLMNVYEPLIFFDEEKTDQFVPRLATNWEISPDGLTYTFWIRQGVKFHNNENLSVEDIEYSFERMLVIERSRNVWGPAWMFYEAFFNVFESQYDNGTFIVTGQQMDDAITSDQTAVVFHLAKPYPPFLQMLSQTWGSILCKKWCIQIGDWPGTWNNWTLYNRPTRTAIENRTTGPPGPRTDVMCGTGPFMLDYYVTNGEWQLLRFNDYWRGWPAPGSSGSLRRVKVLRIDDTQTRMSMFLDGQLDHVQVPRTAIDEVLGQPGVRSIYPLEQLVCEAFFFTFNISTSSPLMGVPGGLPEGTLNQSGIPPDFFTDINVRKGFAYAFNYSQLIAEALRGEAYQPATPIIPGLPFSSPEQEKYSINPDKANLFFSQAWGGQLWSSGFNFTLCYNEGNAVRQKTCEILKANVESLNPKFHLQVQSVPYGDYLDLLENHAAPIFSMGWLADYVDPHNFAYAFMYSAGDFARMQLYSNSTIDTLVMQGIGTMNETARRETYYELQRVYHEDCPSVPTVQPIGRRFERNWVQGWYYNPLLPGNYFYVQWKGSPPSSTTYSWPMFHADPKHTGYSRSPAPGTNQTRWNCTTGDAVYSSPAVADGRVYVGSDDGKVYCLDAYNGIQLWNYTTGGTDSSPAVADGKVYIGSYDAKVFCLDALTGVQIWNYTTIDTVTSSPTIVDGRVYVGSFGARVYCLDAMTGAHIWNRTTGGAVDSSPAVVGGKVYVGSNDGIVHCLDAATGEPVWDCIAGLSIFSSPVVVDNRLYVGADNGTFYCLDAMFGTVIWKHYVGGSVYSSPAVANGRVYVGSENGQIICFYTLTGEWAWNQTIGATDSSPAVADNKVYIGSSDNKVYCYDATTGLPVWTYTTGSPIWSSPAVADGMVFIGSENGRVYAFGNAIRVPEDYNTIQEAINAAAPGATIWIAPGIYNEPLVINKTITLIGKIGSEPTFNGGGSGIAITIVSGGSGSTIAGITITSWDQGIVIDGASGCKVYDNIMSLISQNGIALEGSTASNNQIYSNIFEQDTIAVNLTSSSTNNNIYNNIISSSSIGIDVESSGNVVYGNMITENLIAINIQNSNNNKFFHNDFVSNNMPLSISASTGNVWDDGYPSGGNYWSCHVSVDSFSGLGQNIVGSDGIVDVPFTVATNNTDNYPLLKPFGFHNIGITYLFKSKTVIGQSYTLRVNAKIQNLGMYNETFTFTCFANTVILMNTPVSLLTRNCTILTVSWNTASFAKGSYTLSVVTDPVPDETDTTDNSLSFKVIVTIPGDVKGDFVVDIYDAIILSNAYNSVPASSKWNPNADINCDNIVDIYDAIILANHYNQHYP